MRPGYIYMVLANLSHGFDVGELIECTYCITEDIYRCTNGEKSFAITSHEVFEIGLV